DLKEIAALDEAGILTVRDHQGLRDRLVDKLARNASIQQDPEIKRICMSAIRGLAGACGIQSNSIQSLYEAMGRGECGGFSVPAINLRGMTYDSARAVFRAAIKRNVGAFIFEIARSEIGYTSQRPAEYAASVLAAGIREGFSGPVFIQGDHFQFNAKKYGEDPAGEKKVIRSLIKEAMDAGFGNIDIDTSTLVDLSKSTLEEQQRDNFMLTAEQTRYIRGMETGDMVISVGGEIGEVGKKNSTVEELRAYMNGILGELEKGEPIKGISKISVQSGTTHGGVPLPDGTIAKVKIDFDTLAELSRAAREEFGMAGAVQHGASTLPDEAFDKFPETGTAEIHLATGFQNMIYEDTSFPASLRDEIYTHIKDNHMSEKKEEDTEEQYIYKTRKKAFGPFKEKFWGLTDETRESIGSNLENKFDFLFDKLNVGGTVDVVRKCVTSDGAAWIADKEIAEGLR
ncbi:class II fructose-bisphosphate aldolase, partial [Thermodesulfobacteriota bacterium]